MPESEKMDRHTDFTRWTETANFSEHWEPRAKFAASLIGKNVKVLDIGCGKMTLEKYLHPSCTYLPADIVKRDERTIVCNVNSGGPPAEMLVADAIVLLGVIEYVVDVQILFDALATSKKRIYVSYCDADANIIRDRPSLGWLNAFSKTELVAIFERANYKLIAEDRVDELQSIYTLVHRDADITTKSVGILSYGNLGNFGDRLGFHLVSALMPSHATVQQLYFSPWTDTHTEFDLLIVGIGNSIFKPLINDDLFSLIERSKKAIGIFGTQYRNDFRTEDMRELVASLDYWFARYEVDIDRYAVTNTACHHLGDWLIKEFNFTNPRDESTLRIGAEIWQDLPLDRTIQRIQAHRRVFSERLHPLLCALTSAHEVAYVEQRDSGSGEVSGKFQSMLIDVFGRTFPENSFWSVDRDAVMRYRQKTIANVRHLENVIAGLLQ